VTGTVSEVLVQENQAVEAGTVLTRLGEAVSLFHPATNERLDTLTQQFIARGAEAVAAAQQAVGANTPIIEEKCADCRRRLRFCRFLNPPCDNPRPGHQ